MGLSASQARLLSLTARISDNELHSQTVANSKVRLADKSQEASKEYIRSLNASKLVYTTYDAKGQYNQNQTNIFHGLSPYGCYYALNFMVKEILFFFTSTASTLTLTMSP